MAAIVRRPPAMNTRKVIGGFPPVFRPLTRFAFHASRFSR
ncbi:hypothetical protein DT23_01810 [Thioclava indica]|uniref:Uncharacterized protein n=1 Tax=Thioclava indica TaxID=1353528 RepID=A0A074K1W6_9RHOB|nr:hypothetical protein DT23_01810 [Thioclava indica]